MMGINQRGVAVQLYINSRETVNWAISKIFKPLGWRYDVGG